MINLEYIVTGTNRGGTVYMARLLSSLGIMCGHEAFFDEQGLDYAVNRLCPGEFDSSHVSQNDWLNSHEIPHWFDKRQVRAESSYMAAPFLQHESLCNAAIVHVVRHPLKVISSFVKDVHFFNEDVYPQLKYRSFVLAHTPELMNTGTEIEKACQYWIQWNEMIERNSSEKPYLRFMVGTQLSEELLDFLLVPTSKVGTAFSDDKINSWKLRVEDLTLQDIPTGDTKERLVALAEKYGFTEL